MTIHIASIATAPRRHTPKHRRTQLITAAASAVLVLGAAAGIGGWQTGRDGASIGKQPATALPMPAPVHEATGRATEDVPTYYIVTSAAQAATIQAAQEEANAVRVTSGEPTLAGWVEQVDSAEVEASLLDALSVTDAIRNTLGLAPVRVIDLRPTSEPGARP